MLFHGHNLRVALAKGQPIPLLDWTFAGVDLLQHFDDRKIRDGLRVYETL
jgi:hypothetical protein